MSIVKTAFIAASFVLVALSANAQGREELNTGIHGNTPAVRSYVAAPRIAISREARGAFAQAGAVRSAPMSPLLDMFHGLAVR